ncbi:MAG: type II 3-dehydroquinate dehydratase [Rhodospirillales bacterium]|nr:type II 3-dehydroquinate dehydratase [Rhodospirillaceae bacterium]MDP7097059.1 type II 3-dehydroquinate dehydratase [Rhodospirillales bacterium]HJN23192.1 type II 3-dehydroquinate dehydratase [Rhodospirillales bacterium]
MALSVLVLNGPNLNLLGTREPEVYGGQTLTDIEATCVKRAAALDLSVEFRQSNSEGEMVNWIQQAEGNHAALIVNAGAYTHTSVALLDALLACRTPVIEVHLSNIFQRESFRHESYVSKAARGVICGFGGLSYELALEAAAHLLGTRKQD